MGRSQIKYRSGRGRGAGGRGVSGDSGEARGRRSGGRALASNAFRYAEREDGEDEEETGSDPGPGVDMHRQFFAGEQIYRDMGDTKESYFRTKAVQQWEADDDDDGTPEALVAVGVMDFAWIEDQLSKVSPSIRYQIDHIYCTDLKKQQKIEEDLDPQEAVDVQSQSAHGESLSASEGPARSALDDLLVLSAVAGSTTTKPSPSPPFNSSMGVPLPVQSGGNGPAEDLEEWLDDVLDM